jgi:hypothetical protein
VVQRSRFPPVTRATRVRLPAMAISYQGLLLSFWAQTCCCIAPPCQHAPSGSRPRARGPRAAAAALLRPPAAPALSAPRPVASTPGDGVLARPPLLPFSFRVSLSAVTASTRAAAATTRAWPADRRPTRGFDSRRWRSVIKASFCRFGHRPAALLPAATQLAAALPLGRGSPRAWPSRRRRHPPTTTCRARSICAAPRGFESRRWRTSKAPPFAGPSLRVSLSAVTASTRAAAAATPGSGPPTRPVGSTPGDAPFCQHV